MFDTAIARRFAALICTAVMSATCILGAVGPAATDARVAAPTILTA